MRSLAVLLALVYVVGSALTALLMYFAAWFPYENLSPEELGKDDWLALAAPVVLVLSIAILVAVVKRHAGWAAVAFIAQAVVGLAVLRFALRELSDRSDGRLIAFALGLGLVGLATLTLSFGQGKNA